MNSMKTGMGPLLMPHDTSTEEAEWLADDPSYLIESLDAMPIEMAASWMLTWYRSGDIWRVALSSHYFAQCRYQSWIEGMIGEIRSGIDWRVGFVVDQLANYGEPAVEKLLPLLGDTSFRSAAVEIIARMDRHVLPRIIRELSRTSWGTRLNLIRSYATRQPEAAYGVMVDLLYSTGSQVNRRCSVWKSSSLSPSTCHSEAVGKGSVQFLYDVPLAGGSQ